MKFAIILLIVLALACTAGSLIPQGQTAETYMQAYSKTAAGAILFLGLDDLFHAPWFLLLTAFLCLNLLGCNVIRAPRLLKRMREGFLPEKRLAGAGEQTALVQTREDPAELFRSLGFRDVQTVTDGSGRDARYAVQNRAVVIINRRIIILIEQVLLDQLPYAFVRKIRVDCRSSETEKRRKMMHFPGLARLQDQ